MNFDKANALMQGGQMLLTNLIQGSQGYDTKEQAAISAMSGTLQGASAGSAFGPYGAIAGGALGFASSAFSNGKVVGRGFTEAGTLKKGGLLGHTPYKSYRDFQNVAWGNKTAMQTGQVAEQEYADNMDNINVLGRAYGGDIPYHPIKLSKGEVYVDKEGNATRIGKAKPNGKDDVLALAKGGYVFSHSPKMKDKTTGETPADEAARMLNMKKIKNVDRFSQGTKDAQNLVTNILKQKQEVKKAKIDSPQRESIPAYQIGGEDIGFREGRVFHELGDTVNYNGKAYVVTGRNAMYPADRLEERKKTIENSSQYKAGKKHRISTVIDGKEYSIGDTLRQNDRTFLIMGSNFLYPILEQPQENVISFDNEFTNSPQNSNKTYDAQSAQLPTVTVNSPKSTVNPVVKNTAKPVVKNTNGPAAKVKPVATVKPAAKVKPVNYAETTKTEIPASKDYFGNVNKELLDARSSKPNRAPLDNVMKGTSMAQYPKVYLDPYEQDYLKRLHSATNTEPEVNNKINWSELATDLSSLAPVVSGLFAGRPDTVQPVHNPYAGQVLSTLRGRNSNKYLSDTRAMLDRQQAITNYNTRNLGNLGYATRLQSAINYNNMLNDAYAKAAEMDNNYSLQYANALDNAGNQWASAVSTAREINDKNLAAYGDNYRNSLNQISKWAQNRQLMRNYMNRDNAMMELYAPFLQSGYNTSTIDAFKKWISKGGNYVD